MLPRHTNSTPITYVSLLLWSALAAACARGDDAGESDVVCSEPRVVARLPAVLDEASGVAVSRRHEGVFWIVNDSEPEARVFATDSTGMVRNTVAVRDARNVDWEDIAVGDCGAGDCLYIAEIGDNLHERNDAGFYRVPEPDPADNATARAEWFPIRYPEGAQDAEALFVTPGENVFIITKGRNRAVTLYRYPPPLRAGETIELEPVQELSEGIVQLPDMVTGAGATPDGRFVAVRTYAWLQLYAVRGDTLAPLLPGQGIDLTPLGEPQGEGAAIRADGRVVLTGERGVDAEPAPLSTVQCRLPAERR